MEGNEVGYEDQGRYAVLDSGQGKLFEKETFEQRSELNEGVNLTEGDQCIPIAGDFFSTEHPRQRSQAEYSRGRNSKWKGQELEGVWLRWRKNKSQCG